MIRYNQENLEKEVNISANWEMTEKGCRDHG